MRSPLCGQPYVNQRWLGGLLTNFTTVSKRLARMKELEERDFTQFDVMADARARSSPSTRISARPCRR